MGVGTVDCMGARMSGFDVPVSFDVHRSYLRKLTIKCLQTWGVIGSWVSKQTLLLNRKSARSHWKLNLGAAPPSGRIGNLWSQRINCPGNPECVPRDISRHWVFASK